MKSLFRLMYLILLLMLLLALRDCIDIKVNEKVYSIKVTRQ